MNYPLPNKLCLARPAKYVAVPEYTRRNKGQGIILDDIKHIQPPESVSVGGGNALSPLLRTVVGMIVLGAVGIVLIKYLDKRRR